MPPTPQEGRLAAHAARSSPLSFDRIPTVRTAQELIDSTFHRATKITVWLRDPFQRFKATETARVRSVQNTLDAVLDKYVRRFPSFDNLPPFYRELADLLADVDEVKKSLGAIAWARARINDVADEAARTIKATSREDVVLSTKAQAYGRIASLLKQVDRNLKHLGDARNSLRRLPMVDTAVPTIVVAGYPNVGKSSLIRKVSTAEPEVANYPFTTRGVLVGHFERARVRYQIVDTPGLLDRDFAERNEIEKQAVLAMKHLAHAVVFILDPSEYCGFPLADQHRLLADTEKAFPDVPMLVAENKVDLKRPEATPGRYQISTETGEGIAALMDAAVAIVEKQRVGIVR